MNYSCEEEYNEAMNEQAEAEAEAEAAEMMSQKASEIYDRVNELEFRKQELQEEIDMWLEQLP